MCGMMLIKVDKFLYRDNVYKWDKSEGVYATDNLWDDRAECSFQYTMKEMPESATILMWHVVKGGYI